jgi:thioesterase domain-containing protein/acyl carrier protein
MVPAAFVSMDSFPLTPNGKLDRKALPVPGNKAFASQVYEEPRGEIESHLSGIWEELLHVERVGRNDGFFTLGGHSLMALRMIGRVRAHLGINISLRTLFEAPTIAELAPRLLATGETQEESYDVLLPIKPQGSRPPLFCIHPGIGLSWCFTGLLTQLDPDQPLYGLQARGFTSDTKMAETVDEMALDYVDQIRRIQPQGPYYLLGYSFGGSVAHTMASYLEEQGERVAFLSMMDTPAPGVNRERRASVQVEDEDEDAKKAHLKATFFGKMDKYSTDLTTSFLDKTLVVTQNISRISAARPLRVIKGDLLFFRATVLSEEIESLLCPDDWRPYVLGEIEVCDIECEHLQMDSPESMANIGRVLNRKLNELH